MRTRIISSFFTALGAFLIILGLKLSSRSDKAFTLIGEHHSPRAVQLNPGDSLLKGELSHLKYSLYLVTFSQKAESIEVQTKIKVGSQVYTPTHAVFSHRTDRGLCAYSLVKDLEDIQVEDFEVSVTAPSVKYFEVWLDNPPKLPLPPHAHRDALVYLILGWPLVIIGTLLQMFWLGVLFGESGTTLPWPSL